MNHRVIRLIRTIISAPFAVGAVVLMGIAVFILPKPERLKNKEPTNG